MVKNLWSLLLVLLVAVAAGAAKPAVKKVVFIAGKKSHGPGDHEYEKGLRLLRYCLDTSPNAGRFRTELHLNGWPQDPRTLDDADTVVLYCDGSDHNEADHPLLLGDRLDTLRKQMKRGAGLVVLHYTVFVPQKRGGPEFLDWVGGYFDYETGSAPNKWYSKIRAVETIPYPATPSHPVSRGLEPFLLREEYYYNMRLRPGDARRVPVLNTHIPGEKEPQTVAWAVQREGGGRGFAFTGGHFHSNWSVENFRRMVLNAIVWTAGAEVPPGGVQSSLPTVDEASTEAPLRALILTGHHHPAHDWRATTETLREALRRDARIQVEVWEDPERLAREDLSRFDLLVQNFNNWERPTLSTPARERLLQFVRGGKGLVVLHFANGAWLDWPEYRHLSRRTWIEGTSGHDTFGPFRVEVRRRDHPITAGVPQAWDTTDELYFKQQGDLPIEVLATARSKVTGQDEPMAFVFQEGQGRVFQTVLGHDANAIRTPGTAALIRRAAAWVAGREPADTLVEVNSGPMTAPGRFGEALRPAGGRLAAEGRPTYQAPPLTVECWTKLTGKGGFNVLVANGMKESTSHWELYTAAGTGTFEAFLPGVEPSVVSTAADIVDDRWHHVAMTYEPSRVRLYVDGRQVADRAVTPKEPRAAVGPLFFGGYPPQGIGCAGLVDEVRVSRGIREIQAPEAPLAADGDTLGLWRFDRLDGMAFADVSPTANPARLLSAPPPAAEVFPEYTTSASPGEWPRPDPKTSRDWPNVGNDKGGMRYSPLAQINRETVKDLQVAWTYRTRDAAPGAGSTIESTPIVIDGVMYVTTCSPKVSVVALDAATGKQLWRFNPFARKAGILNAGGVNRGVSYWSDSKEKRILLATADGRLISLDARTGRKDPNFGRGGEVDLRAGYMRDLSGFGYGSTSPPAIFEDRVIIPIVNSEGMPGAPGDIRAFNIRTGKEVWRFHTVPRPHEFGHDTWFGDGWKDRTGANPWAGFTVDQKRGIVFCGTGSAAFDFYGADRKGQNLFSNCTLALDARTGKRLWHFQTIHHDLWDHDHPCPPVLVTVRHNGRKIDAAAQLTKQGLLFLFDRVTGKPLFPVEERPVPGSDVPGEIAWPTQPFPVKPAPFSRHTITEADLTNVSPEANANAREQFRKLRSGPLFTPPSLQGSLVVPGFHGGANWSGGAFDPTTGILYFNSNDVPWISTLVPARPGASPAFGHTGYFRFLDPDGLPAIKPPWGRLNAVNLNTGEYAWQITLGDHPKLKGRGLPPSGTETFGGAIVTAGGLVFIGGTMDEKFHAFDKATGKLLWEYQLPAGGYAAPCTYQVNGRQYVVIAASGGGKLGTKSSDQFIAFALPAKGTGRRP